MRLIAPVGGTEANAFMQITNVSASKRMLRGVLTLEVMDKKIPARKMDYEMSKPYFEAWSAEISNATEGKSYGNVRVMHSLNKAGRLTDPLEFDDVNKKIWCNVYVSDDEVLNGCISGDYCGLSWSGFTVPPTPEQLRKWSTLPDGGQRYIGRPVEVSIVDNPNQPGAYFTVMNAASQPVVQVETLDGTTVEQVYAGYDKNAASTYDISELASRIQDLRYVFVGDQELQKDLDGIVTKLFKILGKMVKSATENFKADNELKEVVQTYASNASEGEDMSEKVAVTPEATPVAEPISNAVEGAIQNAVSGAVEKLMGDLKGVIENAVNGLGIAELKATVDKLAAVTPVSPSPATTTVAVDKATDSAVVPVPVSNSFNETEVKNAITSELGIPEEDPRFAGILEMKRLQSTKVTS